MPIVCTCPCSDIPRKLQKGGETSTASEGSTAALHLLHGRKTSWEAWRDSQCDSKCMYKLGYTTQPVAHALTPHPLKSVFQGSWRCTCTSQQNLQRFKTHSRELNILQPFGTVHLPTNTSQKSGAARQHRTGFQDVSHIFLGCNGMSSAEGGLSGLFNRFHWEWCKTLHQFMMDIEC